MTPGERIKQQLDRWRSDLINLNRNNRLLYYRPTRSSTLEIRAPQATQLLQKLRAEREKGLPFVEPPGRDEDGHPVLEDSDEHGKVLTGAPHREALVATLRNLERRSEQEFMDKGLWVLYLGVGFLKWVDPDHRDETAESPLLLIPVSVARANPQAPFVLRLGEDDPTLNPALAAKLEHDFGINLSSIEELDDDSADPALLRVAEAVATRPDWQVIPRVVLSTFSFHKEVMYRDLLTNAEAISDHPMIQALALGPESQVSFDFEPIDLERVDEQAPPEGSIAILDADASQRCCIAAARDGRSFVMDGPPGTGKSQTIVNVIANLMASGRSVLFVSEKAAALEVVQARMQDAGIGDFVLALHSHKATRREVAKELGLEVRKRPQAGPPLPAVTTERLIARRRELSNYALAVNEVRQPLGLSLHEVLGRIERLHGAPQAPHPFFPLLDAGQFGRIQDLASKLAGCWAPVERGGDFLWRQLVCGDLDVTRRRNLSLTLQSGLEIHDQLTRLARELSSATHLRWATRPSDAIRFAELLELADRFPDVPPAWLTATALEHDAVLDRARSLADAGERVGALTAEGAAIAGANWRSVSPQEGAALEEVLAELSQLQLVEPAEHASLSDFERWSSLLGDSASRIESIRAQAHWVADRLGLPAEPTTLARALALAWLATVAAQPLRPEASWLRPCGLDAARHAAHVLGEAVARVQAAEASLREVFRRDVLDLDLEGLCVRFDTVHRGLGKLRLAFWRDRAAVARCALSGRARNAERSRLRDALEWKRALARLEASQRVHADQLGSEYFGGLDTDFVALAEALEIAGKLLLVLRSETASPWNVAALTLASPPDHEMGHRGRELGAAVAALRARLQAGQGLESPALPTEPLDVAADWCRRSASALLRLSELLRRAGVRLGREVRVAALRSAANLRAKLDQLEDSVKSSSAADTALLGPLYRGAETNPIHVAEAVEGATEIRVLIGGPMEAAGSDALRATSSRLPALRRAAADWNSFGNSILAEFKEDHRSSVREGLEAEFAEGRTYISALAASIDDIDTWGAYSRALASLAHEGLGGTIAYCVGQALPARLVPDVVTRAVLEAWADQAIRGDKRLQQCRAADRDLVVQEFRDLDKQLVRTSVARVVEACNRLRPSAAAGAVALIVRESQKQRRHMPTRRLLADAGPVVQAVKPCFMMSPLTVSQFLPPTMKFDAVVFDEASQVRPCDAIGCIYRGRQLIVAGDQKQLPPTAFFERVSLDGADDRWDEDQVEEFESVLDLCRSTAGLRPLPLLWHYRSRHEDLISFSNYSFYEGRLITFPGARHQGNDVGVELFRVPGVYRRGAARDNPIEAEKVVERVLLHVSKHPTLSLGVVAFSEAQAAAIDLAIEQASKSHPELAKLMSGDRLNGFFVKNLENVQGDERDIMIFSIGYGPDENGKFALSFGPINRAGGERRLNVAITRARLRVEVVSSIGAADFQGTSTSPGVLHLKKYLDFAGRQENKIRAVTAAAAETGAATESPFEDEVLRVVRSWGYDAVPQVGCAGYRVDIGVKHPARPGSYLLGIECDGASYHSARAARDRDRLRQSVLEGLGWRLHRIWGPAWYRTRAEQVDRLRTCLDSALGAQPPVPRTVSVRMEPPASVVLDLDSPPCWTRPYHVAKPTPPPCPVAIHHHSAQTHIVRMITEVVDVESPVCSELVLERIREAWGLQRAGSRVRDAFDEALRRVLHVGQVTRSQTGCLVASGRVLDAVRVPDSAPATRRTITEMPREEIAMAVQRLVADVRLISRDELPVRVARLFGWGRTGSEIAEAIERVVLALLDAGVLRAEGDQLRPMEATPGTRPSGPNAHPGRGPTS